MSYLQIPLASSQDTYDLGFHIGQCVPLPLLIGLSGDLGAGKTSLSQAIGRGFGIAETMPSPTFTLLNQYQGPRGTLYHLDIYRLGSIDELWDLGFEDLLYQPDALILIEWFNQFSDWPLEIPQWQIYLSHDPPGRLLNIEQLDYPEFAKELSAWHNTKNGKST